MGYLVNLITSLSSQINTAPNDATRIAIASQLAIAQRAAGSTGIKITVGYLVNLKASIESQIDVVMTDGERSALISQLAMIATAINDANSSNAIGDCKSGLQVGDHNGWILFNGRAKSTLTATQQTAATSLGIGTTIPDATGRSLIQGAVGQQVGSAAITQSNLPNVNLIIGNTSAGTPTGTVLSQSAGTPSGTVTIVTHSSDGGGFDPNPTSGVSNLQQTDRTPENTIALGTGIGGGFAGAAMPIHNHNFTGNAMPAHSHSASLGGSNFPYIPAGIGVNHFLYLGY